MLELSPHHLSQLCLLAHFPGSQAKSRGETTIFIVYSSCIAPSHICQSFCICKYSGTLKETSPIHLDLFEVIKAAIASGEKGEGAGELEVEEEPEEEAKEQPLEAETVAKPPTTTNTIFSQMKAVFRQVVATISSLPHIQQIVLAFIVFYFITKIVFVRKDSAAETINDLNQKIDDLTKEVKEMKAMLKSVLRLSEQSQSSHERDEL